MGACCKDVVDAMIDEIVADAPVPTQKGRELHFRADAVCAGDKDWIAVFSAELEEAGERANVRENFARMLISTCSGPTMASALSTLGSRPVK